VATVCATGGHYAEAVAGARLRQQRGDKAVQVLAAQAPLDEIVAQLNRFRPAILAPYASIGARLASEQDAGRMHIDPALVVLSAEGLPVGGYDRIAKAFGVAAHHSYAATECPFLSYSCDRGWLHVNSDWVVLEPVDADGRPTPPGTESHTVLISNLANRAQPILRYDLGDRVLQRPDPCPCGNQLPAIRVEGRTADVLTFSAEHGEPVSIPALMFEVVDALGVEQFQIVQTTPASLRVRVRPAAGADPDRVWQAVRAEVTRVLKKRGLDHVTVERAEEPPAQSVGAKYRAVIPLGSTST
jgi:phenylacetate-coenzyme A ligase PaaK-like adenylate-forming protein